MLQTIRAKILNSFWEYRTFQKRYDTLKVHSDAQDALIGMHEKKSLDTHNARISLVDQYAKSNDLLAKRNNAYQKLLRDQNIEVSFEDGSDVPIQKGLSIGGMKVITDNKEIEICLPNPTPKKNLINRQKNASRKNK